MKLLINLLAVAAFALPLNIIFAEHGADHECCDQKDCCKDCKHEDGKHSKDCCKNCEDQKCKKACKTGNCKKGHCDMKKSKDKADEKAPQSKVEEKK